MAMKAGIQLSVDSKGNLKIIDLVRNDVKRLNLETRKSRKELQALNRRSAKTIASLRKMGNSARSAGVLLLGAFGAASFAGIAQRADQMRLLESRIQRVTSATDDYNVVNSELTRIAFDNGVALKGTADLFINIQRSAKDLGASNQSALQLTNTVQQLGVISGASSEAMKNSLLQLSQAFAGNIFRAEEWNSVVENTPEIANRIAQGMGKTVGEVRKMVVAGELLSKDVFEVLLKQSGDIQKDFEQMPLTLDRATNRLGVNFDRFLDSVNKSYGATEKVANIINSISLRVGDLGGGAVNFDNIAISAGVLAGVLGLRLSASLIKVSINSKIATGSLASFNGVMGLTGSRAKGAAIGLGLMRGSLALIGGPAGVATLAGVGLFYMGKQINSSYREVNKLIPLEEEHHDVLKLARKLTDEATNATKKRNSEIQKTSELLLEEAKARLASFNADANKRALAVSNNPVKVGRIGGLAQDPEDLYRVNALRTSERLVKSEIAVIDKLTIAVEKQKKIIEKRNREYGRGIYLTERSIAGEQEAAAVQNKIESEAQKQYEKANASAQKLLKTTQLRVDALSKSSVQLYKESDAYKFHTATQRKNNIANLELLSSKKKLAVQGRMELKNSDDYKKLLAGENLALDKSILLIGKKGVEAYKLGLLEKGIHGLDLKRLITKKNLEVALKKQLELDKKAQLVRKSALKLLTTSKIKVAELTAKLKGQAVAIKGLTIKEVEELRVSRLQEVSLQKQIDLRDKYNKKIKSLSQSIEAKTILVNKGEEAERLYSLAQEYGNKKRAEAIRMLELEDVALDRNINSVNAMRDAILTMANDGEDGLRSLFDAFGKSISTDGINGAIANLKQGMSGLFSSDPSKGGGFGNVFTTAFDTVKNFKLSENGNHGEEYGSAAGKVIGSYWGPVGSAVGKFIGKFIGGFFADDPRAQLGTVTQANENIGAGGSKDGFYRNRFANGRNFYRDTGFGKVGFISGETKNVRGEATEQSMQFLDAMKSLYDTTASFLDENTIAKAKENISKKGVEALDPEKGIVEQYKIIIDSMSSDLKSLYEDTGDSFDELAQRAGQIAITAKTGVPYFKSLNLNMGKTNDSALANTVRFADLAGGLNNLIGSSSHYYDVVSSNAEKLDYQRKQSELAVSEFNKELGLTGTASINSLAGLKMYTNGLDLTTEAGREAALASYAVVDSFDAIAKQDEARANIIKSYHDAGLSANIGLEALKGGIDGLLPSVANYTSKFSEANQQLIKQGKFAQDIISVGDDFGIDPAKLDSFAELRVQVENFKGNPEAVEALLGLADASDFIGKSGLSAVDALSGVDKSLLNIVGGVQTLEMGTSASIDSMIASNDSLASSADTTNESINNLSAGLGSFTSTANESADLLRQLVSDGQKQLALNREQSAEITRLRAETEEANKEAAIARDNALYLEEKAQREAA